MAFLKEGSVYIPKPYGLWKIRKKDTYNYLPTRELGRYLANMYVYKHVSICLIPIEQRFNESGVMVEEEWTIHIRSFK